MGDISTLDLEGSGAALGRAEDEMWQMGTGLGCRRRVVVPRSDFRASGVYPLTVSHHIGSTRHQYFRIHGAVAWERKNSGGW
jgi:hypothetical protein